MMAVTVLVGLWAAALVNAHLCRWAKGSRWYSHTISFYMQGKASGAVDLGFVLLGVALVLLAGRYVGTPAQPLYYLAAIAAVGVMWTRAIVNEPAVHYCLATALYALAVAADGMVAWPHPRLFVLAVPVPVLVAIVDVTWFKRLPVAEKTIALPIIAFIVLICWWR